MTKDQITALAREHGTSYTNRHFVGEPAVAFGNEAWAAFCEALASPQPVQQSVQPVAVISGAFGGRPCIRILDTAAIYPDGTALYTSPPIAQPVQSEERDALQDDVARLLDAAKRLVEHANFRLGGILSDDSKSKKIPSNATSQVKARHLASLRYVVAAMRKPK